MNALDYPALLQFALRNAAYAVCAEIRVSRLYASETAEVLVSDLLPLGYEILVGYILVQAVIVEF